MHDLPENPWPAGSQKWRIYKRLAQHGRVKNVEIMYGLGGPRIMNGTGRTSEIRAWLRNYGISLPCQVVSGKVFEYQIGGR